MRGPRLLPPLFPSAPSAGRGPGDRCPPAPGSFHRARCGPRTTADHLQLNQVHPGAGWAEALPRTTPRRRMTCFHGAPAEAAFGSNENKNRTNKSLAPSFSCFSCQPASKVVEATLQSWSSPPPDRGEGAGTGFPTQECGTSSPRCSKSQIIYRAEALGHVPATLFCPQPPLQGRGRYGRVVVAAREAKGGRALQ